MIACFPDGYPDELFYSLCARYANRMNYPIRSQALHDLFNSEDIKPAIELPCHLDTLVRNLPHNSGYSAESFIDNNTLLPFYAPFIPSQRLCEVRERMRNGTGAATLVGITSRKNTTTYVRRFCPQCITEDRAQFGETYWHRVHQLVGIEVCPTHAMFLQEATPRVKNGLRASQVISAEQALSLTPHYDTQFIDRNNRTHTVMLACSRDAAWLLSHPCIADGLNAFYPRYREALFNQHFMTYGGRVLRSKLIDAFVSYYPADLLSSLGCEIDLDISVPWPADISRKSKKTINPLRYLLMIHFLGHSIDTFFDAYKGNQAFGCGPWPCLNPACSSYRQLVIHTIQISRRRRLQSQVVGKFLCHCGFMYCRVGPDPLSTNQFSIHRILVFGPIWEERLRTLWNDPAINLYQTIQLLGTDKGVIMRHAHRLGLSFPPPGSRSTQETVEKPLQGASRSHFIGADFQQKRTEWLELIASKQGDKDFKISQGEHRPLYLWLRTHDSAWASANTPSSRHYQKGVGPPKKNFQTLWEERDEEYASQIAHVAQQVKQITPPVRVTMASISRILLDGKNWYLSTYKDKLPQTTQAVVNEVEAFEQFQVRRIWWIFGLYSAERQTPTRTHFEKRAWVYPARAQPLIRAAVDAAMEALSA